MQALTLCIFSSELFPTTATELMIRGTCCTVAQAIRL